MVFGQYYGTPLPLSFLQSFASFRSLLTFLVADCLQFACLQPAI